MGRVLLGVVLDSDFCEYIRSMHFSCDLHFQADRFKVLDLDTMLVEDVGIDGLDDLIDYEPCLDEEGFIDVEIICKRSDYGFVCFANLDGGDYLVFDGDALVSEDYYLIMYSFNNFDIVFNGIDYTYSIVVFGDYDLTEYKYRIGNYDCRNYLEDIELSSVSGFCEKIDDKEYIVNDCLIVAKLKECIIAPNKIKKILFVNYGWTEDLEYNIVISPSVEHIKFTKLFWTDRINYNYTKYLQIALPSSNFDKLYKIVVDSLIDRIKVKLYSNYSLALSAAVSLYDTGLLSDEGLTKLLDDLSIKIFKY